MIAETETGNVAVVIAKDLSRIGRDYLQTGFYTEVFFREKGIRFIAIANNIDSNFIGQFDPSGDLLPHTESEGKCAMWREYKRKQRAKKKQMETV